MRALVRIFPLTGEADLVMDTESWSKSMSAQVRARISPLRMPV